MKGWLSRISMVFLALCLLTLVAFILGAILLGTAWKAPKGCEECDPYIGRLFLVYGMLALSLLCAVIGIAFRVASGRMGGPPAIGRGRMSR